MGPPRGDKTVKNATKKQEGIIVTDNAGTVHGYARCSTNETRQDIDRQVRELKAAGVTRIWMEYEHGDAPTKEQQDMMWDTVRPGETVIIAEPSRLSRSVQQFCEIVDVIKSKRIRLQILGSITIDCRRMIQIR